MRSVTEREIRALLDHASASVGACRDALDARRGGGHSRATDTAVGVLLARAARHAQQLHDGVTLAMNGGGDATA